MMKRFGLAIVALAGLFASPALAQSTFPTAQGGRVAGVVTMVCNVNGANCAPAAAGAAGSGVDASGNQKVVGPEAINQTPTTAPVQIGFQSQIDGTIKRAPGNTEGLWVTGARADGVTKPNGAYPLDVGCNPQDTIAPTTAGFARTANCDRTGKLRVIPITNDGSASWSYAAGASGLVNTTTAITLKTAGGATIRNYICTLNLSHDTLGGATEAVLRDGAAGTVMWRGRLQTAAIEGGSDITFTPCLRATANNLVEFATLTAVTGGIYVNAQGYVDIN